MSAPAGGVVFLHALDRLPVTASRVFVGLLAELGLAHACPDGGDSWWLGPDAEATIYAAAGAVAPPGRPVALVGLSVGGGAALRVAFGDPVRFPVVVALLPVVEVQMFWGRGTALDARYASPEDCRQDAPGTHLRPPRVPPHLWIGADPADAHALGVGRLREKLLALGVAHHYDTSVTGDGHGWRALERLAGPALRFVAAGLAAESRRFSL